MDDVLAYVEANSERYLEELGRLVAIPSVSTSTGNAADVRRAAEWLAGHMQAMGLEHVGIHPTAGHPIVYADWLHAAGRPTVLLYGHYDVQPAEPLDLWTTPPFEATVRNGRLYGRGTADDKGQVFIHLKSIEALLSVTGSLPVNVKILLEGEEEIGSDHLEAFVAAQRTMLAADLVLMSDTPFFGENLPAICYGLRGLSYLQVRCIGPNRDLHSGSFGGTVHNPIQALAEIIALLHDRNGRVAIPGFYDDVRPLTRMERQAFKALPHSDRAYARDLGVRQLYGEKGFTTLERVWARPTLECNGIWGGFTGEGAKTVLPSVASAKISMRLVPDQSSARIARLFTRHLRTIAPKTVQLSVTNLHGGEPAITPLDSPGVRAASAALKKGFGKTPLYQREGGSIPIVVQFKKVLGADTVLLGFGQPDENAHAPDEFLSLSHFYGGIRTSLYFFHDLPRFMEGGHR